jgi:threonine dehydrogenase-like Zn-dependent dehydrogenase
MAEYLSVPDRYVIKLPDSVSYEYGALIEPFAVGYHAVIRAGEVENKTTLIIGAGTIGLLIRLLVKR